MTFPFPAPCPVCGAGDEHAAWRAAHPVDGISATHCPHPAARGHGTGCMCSGFPRLSPLGFPLPVPQAPPAADMRYEDEDANRVARVVVRVEWANGRIREYEAAEPEAFSMNDPETDLRMQPMRMSVQSGGSPVVPMMAAVPELRLLFRANPKHNMHIRTERTAGPSGGNGLGRDEGQGHRRGTGDVRADSGDGEGNQFPPLLQGGVDLIDQPPGFHVRGGLAGGDG